MLGEREILEKARRLKPEIGEEFAGNLTALIKDITRQHYLYVFPKIDSLRKVRELLRYSDPKFTEIRQQIEAELSEIGFKSFQNSGFEKGGIALVFTNVTARESLGDTPYPMQACLVRIGGIDKDYVQVIIAPLASVNHGKVDLNEPAIRDIRTGHFEVNNPIFLDIADLLPG